MTVLGVESAAPLPPPTGLDEPTKQFETVAGSEPIILLRLAQFGDMAVEGMVK